VKLSTRTRYGLRAVAELALRGAWKGAPEAPASGKSGSALARLPVRRQTGGRPVPLAAIAKRQGISEQYLRQIFMRLRRAGVVRGVLGKSGGYLLARDPGLTSALDVVRALGEQIDPVFCVRAPSRCRRVKECPTHPLWAKLGDLLKEALSATTVAELAERCPTRGRQSMPRGYVFEI
jgi:Rrf2 family iron-sulfur cluster assembly transcriptional regulator